MVPDLRVQGMAGEAASDCSTVGQGDLLRTSWHVSVLPIRSNSSVTFPTRAFRTTVDDANLALVPGRPIHTPAELAVLVAAGTMCEILPLVHQAKELFDGVVEGG
jgi:hypothetical protein